MNNEMTVVRSITKDETAQLKGIAICCVILGHMNLLPGGCHRSRGFSGFKWIRNLSIL